MGFASDLGYAGDAAEAGSKQARASHPNEDPAAIPSDRGDARNEVCQG